MIFQTTNVGLNAFSLTTTVGIVGQCKILPQIFIDIVTNQFSPTALKIVGTVLTVFSAISYAFYRLYHHRKQQKELELKQHGAFSHFKTVN